jgi:hypothetical protein
MSGMWKYLMVMLGILLLVGILVLAWKIFIEPDSECCGTCEGDVP